MPYEISRSSVQVVDGVEVDLTLRDAGAGERTVDQTEIHLLESLCRLAWAYEEETDPRDLPDELPDEFTPPMSVAWERVFSDENEEGANA